MTIWVPSFAQGGSYSAQIVRFATRADDWDEGIRKRTSLKVTQRASGANLSVDVAAGDCIVQGDDQVFQGNYDVRSDAVTNLAGFAAPGSNSRYDLVGIQVNDPNAGGAAGSNAVIVRVAGTASGTPVIPAIPPSFLLLAIVGPITTSTTSITNAMIHTAWTGTGPTGVAGAGLLAGFRAPPGTSQETYNSVSPNGWFFEDGRSLSTTTYADLFEHLGYTHGGSGGNFNLPDSRGRVGVAAGAGSFLTLGAKTGAETHAISQAELPAVSITIDPPSTTLSLSGPDIPGLALVNIAGTGGAAGGTQHLAYGPGTSATNTGSVDIPAFQSGNLGSGAAATIVQPSIVINRMIRS